MRQTYDEGQDNIANSSTDDMFAFSQIIAGVVETRCLP